MTRSYAWPLTVTADQPLVLHVSTDAARFGVRLFRCGVTVEELGRPDTEYEGVSVPFGSPTEAWGWPRYEVDLPEGLPDGVYVAVPAERDSNGALAELTADRSILTRGDAAAFVLRRSRSARPGGVIVKLPTATYAAYNQLGGASLYAGAMWVKDWSAAGYAVSLQRPGNGGVGGRVMEADAPSPYRRSSRRQTFAHWDAPFIEWFESHWDSPTYCTDFDLHDDPHCLDGHSLLISVGHDEYWSERMRSAVLEFVDHGGNVCFFAGDMACFEVEFAPAGDRMYCRKIAGGAPDSVAFRHPGALWHANDRDDWLTLSSGMFGGGWWDGRRSIEGYRVAVANHWAFDDVTEPPDGITGGEQSPIVGYETDGVPLARDGGPTRVESAGRGGNGGRVLLAAASLRPGWVTNGAEANAAMMTRTASSGGIVVSTGTTDWPLGLATDPAVQTISHNIVSRLSRPSLRLHGPIWDESLQVGGGEVVGAGTDISWYVDGTQLIDKGLREPRWEVRGGSCTPRGWQATTRCDDGQTWLTVTATASGTDGTTYFGSRTVRVLDREEYLRRRAVRLLAAIAYPDEQGGALVDQSASEEELAGRLIPVRVAWARARIAALTELLDELTTTWSRSDRLDDSSLREDEK